MTNVTISRELLPCPFCYPHPVCDEYPPVVTKEIPTSDAWCIHAPCCDFYGPLARSPEEAVKKWNTRAAPAQDAKQVVPEGYVLVPVEPTPEMLTAPLMGGRFENRLDLRQHIYKAMIAAAPKQEGA